MGVGGNVKVGEAAGTEVCFGLQAGSKMLMIRKMMIRMGSFILLLFYGL
jgi:hypothetical protein